MNLQTMYPGINNSPVTELASNIDGAATSIALLNATALPPAPNIATIGTEDDNAELVLYTGKSENTLTGCVRGFNGTVAQMWPAGTVTYRVYTAYDHDKFVDNIQALDQGKMDAAVYDTDNNGIVDNAEKLGGKLPSAFVAADGSVALTGNLRYKIGERLGTPMLIIPGSGVSGDAVLLSNGGLTVVGSGEFPTNWVKNFDADSPAVADGYVAATNEHLILGSDQGMRFYVNANTIASRLSASLNKDLNFYPDTTGTGGIGSAACRWQDGYINQIYPEMLHGGHWEPTAIANGDDLLTYTKPGVYMASSTVIAQSLKNAPTGVRTFWMLVVSPYPDGAHPQYATQIVIPISTAESATNSVDMFIRNVGASSASRWFTTMNRSQAGYFNISAVPAGSSMQQTITFPNPFIAVPTMSLTPRQVTEGTHVYVKEVSRNATSCIVEVWHDSSAATTIGVDWAAFVTDTTTAG